MTRLPQFTPDGRAGAIVVLGQSVFSNIRCAAFNSYILHRDHESAFLTEAHSAYEDGAFTLVAANVFGLDFFPDHKVGMIIYKGRGTFDQKVLEKATEAIRLSRIPFASPRPKSVSARYDPAGRKVAIPRSGPNL
jgi:hypothetical protein